MGGWVGEKSRSNGGAASDQVREDRHHCRRRNCSISAFTIVQIKWSIYLWRICNAGSPGCRQVGPGWLTNLRYRRWCADGDSARVAGLTLLAAFVHEDSDSPCKLADARSWIHLPHLPRCRLRQYASGGGLGHCSSPSGPP